MNTLSINSCFVFESYIISIVVSSINININGIFLLKVLMLRICISLFTDQHSVPPNHVQSFVLECKRGGRSLVVRATRVTSPAFPMWLHFKEPERNYRIKNSKKVTKFEIVFIARSPTAFQCDYTSNKIPSQMELASRTVVMTHDALMILSPMLSRGMPGPKKMSLKENCITSNLLELYGGVRYVHS